MRRRTLLTTREAAEYLQLSPQTLHQWRTEVRGLRYLKFNKAIRYDLEDLERWLQSCIVDPEDL